MFLPLTRMYQRLPLAYSQQVVTALAFVATATIQKACGVLWCPGFRTPFQSILIVACQVYHWSSQWLPALAPLWSGGYCTAQQSPDIPVLGVHSCHGYAITRKSHQGHSLSTLWLWPRGQPFTISLFSLLSPSKAQSSPGFYQPWHLWHQVWDFLVMNASHKPWSWENLHRMVKAQMWQGFFPPPFYEAMDKFSKALMGLLKKKILL